jgi:hypothetical protein
MDFSDTQSLHELDDEQISMLAVLVHGVYGPDLTRAQFNDVMLGLFEQIAGFEILPARVRQQHLTTLWHRSGPSSKYTSTEPLDLPAIPTWNAVRLSPNLYHSNAASVLHRRVMQWFDSDA